MEISDVVEDFYGVYLLKCLNPDYFGRTYIGFTVDPNRRIKQHNKGKEFGGAWRTSKRGPWEMSLIVHGFPTQKAALKFEWAWQHPTKSKNLKKIVTRKKSSESTFNFCLRIMHTMLRVPPWCRLPLTLRWLSAESAVDTPLNLTPPVHMPIVFGPVSPKKLKPTNQSLHEEEFYICRLCYDSLTAIDTLVCLKNECNGRWHIICLAKKFLDKESNNILPVEGSCTECDSVMLWGDLIRKKKGCYSLAEKSNDSVIDVSY